MAYASIISGAVQLVSGAITGIVTGISGYYEQREQAENAEAVAEQERLNAKRAEEAARQKTIAIEQKQAAEERLQRQENSAMLARNRARIGMGGLDFSGSPLLVEIDTVQKMEMDIQNERIAAQNAMQDARYEGHLLAVSHPNKAAEQDYLAGKLRQAANASAISAAAVGLEGFAPGLKDGANAYAASVGGKFAGQSFAGLSDLTSGIGNYSLQKKANSGTKATGNGKKAGGKEVGFFDNGNSWQYGMKI